MTPAEVFAALRMIAEALARQLHDGSDERGFFHNCVAHPLWWAVCRPDREPEPDFTGWTTVEGVPTGDHRAIPSPAPEVDFADIDFVVEGRFARSAGIIKSIYDGENFEHDATLVSIADEGLDPEVLLSFLGAAAESTIVELSGTDLRRDAADRCPSCHSSVKPQSLSPIACFDPWHVSA